MMNFLVFNRTIVEDLILKMHLFEDKESMFLQSLISNIFHTSGSDAGYVAPRIYALYKMLSNIFMSVSIFETWNKYKIYRFEPFR